MIGRVRHAYLIAKRLGNSGPRVTIQAGTGCFCAFDPPATNSCIAACDYTAVDSGFEQPVTNWIWAIESGNAEIVAGQGTEVVTVQTPIGAGGSAVNETFSLKVVASWA